jgi:3-methyl-2-oxobutanoate hydroxymethyltransferase
MDRITVLTLREMKERGERIAAITCYDATFTRVLEAAGAEVLLVGDSLGMVLQGAATTTGVTVADMVYHTRCVCHAARRALVVADLPFQSYATPKKALDTAARLMGEGGAAMVKMEGGGWLLPTIERMSERGIPVCGHLGLLPQSVHRLGGHRVQGRGGGAAEAMVREAQALEDAGAMALVIECVPRALAAALAAGVSIPVIGIGAGNACDGQVLVLHDLLGLSAFSPRFARNFLEGAAGGVAGAVAAYVAAVKEGTFPAQGHGFD